MTLIVRNLHGGYGPVDVLHDINIEIPRGELISLIGANGAGKTSILRALSGTLPQMRGEIRLGDQSIAGLPSHRIAALGIAHSPEGRRVFPALSVLDNLHLGAFTRYRGLRTKGDIEQDIEEVMALFPRLRERRKQLAGTLSGGEQQMLAMARALMLRPEVLLLDEPSMGLAPLLVDEVFRILRTLRQRGVTMLLVEQFADAALAVSDFAYVIENGRIVLQGDASQLRRDPAVKAAYLGG